MLFEHVNAAMASIPKKGVIIVGGSLTAMSSTASRRTEILRNSSRNKKWERICDLPVRIMHSTLTVMTQDIYLFGGNHDKDDGGSSSVFVLKNSFSPKAEWKRAPGNGLYKRRSKHTSITIGTTGNSLWLDSLAARSCI